MQRIQRKSVLDPINFIVHRNDIKSIVEVPWYRVLYKIKLCGPDDPSHFAACYRFGTTSVVSVVPETYFDKYHRLPIKHDQVDLAHSAGKILFNALQTLALEKL